EPLEAGFGAQITGLHLSDIRADEFAALYNHWLEFALLVFPEQFLSNEQQIEFARRFGALEFDIAPISNVKDDGTIRPNDGSDDMMQVINGNMGWHHDSTYMRLQAKGAVFSADVVPESGGATGFADMRAAYDALDKPTRNKIENLSAHHSLYHSQAKIGHEGDRGSHSKNFGLSGSYSGYGFHDGPVSIRRLVKTHPETQRKNLLIGRHAYNIVGLGEQESEELLQSLNEFACEPERTYHHQWQAGDALLWDNRCLMHRATPWPMHQPRIMWHSRIAGDDPAEAAYPA
ncbi:MAG: TauD/TfdA dioxygenase family protein, partial [Gammaproteobacteria bacterium]